MLWRPESTSPPTTGSQMPGSPTTNLYCWIWSGYALVQPSHSPAMLLLDPQEETLNNCRQILVEAHGIRKDLTNQPLTDAEVTWYTDGSSYLMEGEQKAGAAVVDRENIIWASALPLGTLTQRAELISLTQTLKKVVGKKANIYTDSQYAFATAHVHGEIYRRRGLLTSEGKEIKNKNDILDLLQALFLPKKLSITHCPGRPSKGGHTNCTRELSGRRNC